ncbi:MAG: formylglycine-generating enzyme family protein [Cyanobacteria bacterium P01_D01_bin.1]
MEISLPLSYCSFETISVDESAHTICKQTKQAHIFVEKLPEGAFIEMVKLPAQTAKVGSPLSEKGRMPDEDRPYWVAFDDFFISKYPITQFQWKAVASLPKVKDVMDPNPAHFTKSNNPVEQVSWFDAMEFCDRLSKYTKRSYRLPTEVEWEYACRGGTQTPFCFGKTLTNKLCNIGGKGTTPVNAFVIANPFGLYDMHGNVCEWCLKNSNDESEIEESRYQQPAKGGSWKSALMLCRSATNLMFASQTKDSSVGFRIIYTGSDSPKTSEDAIAAHAQTMLSNVNVGGDFIINGNLTQEIQR